MRANIIGYALLNIYFIGMISILSFAAYIDDGGDNTGLKLIIALFSVVYLVILVTIWRDKRLKRIREHEEGIVDWVRQNYPYFSTVINDEFYHIMNEDDFRFFLSSEYLIFRLYNMFSPNNIPMHEWIKIRREIGYGKILKEVEHYIEENQYLFSVYEL